MHVQRLDHVNILSHDLEATRAFYVDVVGLRAGERPPFTSPGLWLYADTIPVIHVNGLDAADARVAGSGSVDHIAFRVAGLASMRERIRRNGIAASECIVPRNGDLQIFVCDPSGVKIELTFAAAEVAASESLIAH
jgi:catechol 2,3-dioxygenase-like lactoylglutathione lyase family enzyme